MRGRTPAGERSVTCREFADFLMDYVSGDLPDEVRQAFVDHLELCPNCQRYLESYEESIALGRRAFDDAEAPVPAEVPEELIRAILASRRRQ